MLAQRLFIPAATPSLYPKIADPATKTLAPASTAIRPVSASMPPSTSRSHAGLIRSIISRTRPIFGSVVSRKTLVPEARVDCHDQYLINVKQNLFEHSRTRSRVDRHAGALVERFD